jgi:hypothetical protein
MTEKLMVVQSQDFCPFGDNGVTQSKPIRRLMNEALGEALYGAARKVDKESFNGFPSRIDVELRMSGLDAQWVLTFYGDKYAEVKPIPKIKPRYTDIVFSEDE